MTFELAIMIAFAGAIGFSTFVAALWGALESTSVLSQLRERGASDEKIALAKLLAFRSNARAFLVLVLSAIAVIRLSASDLVVTSSTYAMFGLLLVAQIVVASFVLLDVYERTSIFSGSSDDKED